MPARFKPAGNDFSDPGAHPRLVPDYIQGVHSENFMEFSNLGLNPALLRAVAESGYTIATPIQTQAIPAVLQGRDIMAAAQTGTGKTAGFTLPMLQMLADTPAAKERHIKALVLTPTRELAAQVQESIATYGVHTKVRSVVIFGGVNIGPQIKALKQGTDILVATPGRLLDLYQQKAVSFESIQMLVLDEADRMLDMGFIRDIRRILAILPKKRQNLMFSATFSPEIRDLARTICRDPLEIDVSPRNSTVKAISQEIYMVSKENKLGLLAKLLSETPDQVLVFSRTKHGANNLVKKLAGFRLNAAAIHGNKSQAQRTKALSDFKNDRIQILVATDIAARGIDIDQLAMVINFDLPQVPEDYVHRIGRTGRAGASGLAVSLVTEDETKQLKQIQRLIKIEIPVKRFDVQDLPQATVKEVPETAQRQQRQASGANRSRSAGNKPRRHPESQEQGARSARKPQGRNSKPRQGNQQTEANAAAPKSGNRSGIWSSLKQGFGQMVKGAA